MWADASTLYHRATTTADGATVWNAANDIKVGEWTGDTGYASIDASNGLKMEVNDDDGVRVITKTFVYTSGAKLTFDAIWNNGSYVKSSGGWSYTYFYIGNNIMVRWYARDATKDGVLIIANKEYELGKFNSNTELTIHLVVDTYTNIIEAFTITGTKADATSLSWEIPNEDKTLLPNTTTYNTLDLKINRSKSKIDTYLKSIMIQEEKNTSLYQYTINYKLNGEGDAVKSVNDIIVAEESVDTEASFFVNEKKYYRKEGEVTSVTIDENNKTVDIAIREAETWHYTISQQVSSEVKGTIEGTFIEGESLTYAWPRYVLDGTTLYDYSTSGTADYRTTVIPSADEYEITKAYDAGSKTDVVLFKESDEIEGATNGAESNIGSRLTNGSAAKSSSPVTAFSLGAGTYKIVARLIGQSVGATFSAGAITLMSQTHSSNTGAEYESGIFKLSATTDINFTGSSTSGGLDYVYVQSVASDEITISAVDNLGYTYSSKSAIDFTETSIRAYIATYDNVNDVVRLTRVTKVPANQGLIIMGTPGNVNVLATSESTDDVTGNKLMAVSKAMTLTAAPEGYENYVLALEGNKAVFQLVSGTSASMTAGQAYLQIPKRNTGGSARSLRIAFDDNDATGIADVRGKKENVTNEYYNLSGQRVAQPTKGLYIVNGKKVIMK